MPSLLPRACRTLAQRLATLARSTAAHPFVTDRRGVVVVMYALAVLPVIGLTGATLDYSRTAQVRTTYQHAADAAVLAATVSGLPTLAAREALARDVFLANAPESGHELTRLHLTETEIGYRLSVGGSVDATLLELMGVEAVDFTVGAEATAGSAPLEIAFVIDATNSMLSGSRWRTAYDSLDAMLHALDGGARAGDELTVTVVPMGDAVNIGRHRQDWVYGLAGQDARAGGDRGRRGHWNDEEYEGQGSENDQGRRGHRDETTGPGTDAQTLLDPARWAGCVFARQEPVAGNPYRLTDAVPDDLLFEVMDQNLRNHAYPGRGERRFECPRPIIGPTGDVRQVMAEVDTIRAAGTGRFDQGMAWGWRAVSPEWAGLWGLRDYPDTTGEREKVIVFITDGNSTMEEWRFDGVAEWGWNNAGTEMLGNLVDVCSQAKAQGITVYTLFVAGNRHAESYMRACASSPAHYFDVTRNDAMASAFATMGAALSNARLVR